MLYAGEEIGDGHGPEFDLAVDPLEGTNLCARGWPGAITVLAAAPRHTFAPIVGFYMDKLVVGPAGAAPSTSRHRSRKTWPRWPRPRA